MNRTLFYLTVALILGLLTGCGTQRSKPRGQLTKGGQPYLAREGEVVHISLFPLNADGSATEGTAHPAQYDPQTGAFQVPGPDGDGIAPGKYRLTVQLTKNRTDLLQGKAGVSNSPFVFDVTADSELKAELDQLGQMAPEPKTGRRQK
jgi:hypothetical protein